MTRATALVVLGLACAACSGGQDQARDRAADTMDCLATRGGYLRAQLRGALNADLAWSGADMQCEGSPRPDGHGIRLTFAGPLPAQPGSQTTGTTHQLRFIFGIDERDTATGAALAMPTNLTVILEGEGQLYATRGDRHCAVESLERSALAEPDHRRNRVHARGYCLGPATNATGDSRLLVPTFEFTGVADTELEP